MLKPPKKWVYYPKLFQDYVEYSSRTQNKHQVFQQWGFNIFTQEEKKEIDKALISQIKAYFLYRNIQSYNSDWFDFVKFEQKDENSYSTCWDSHYMNWFLQIAQVLPEVKRILQENYKAIILFYPLMYGDEVEEYFFTEILPDRLKKDDIEYILKAYSEDLHENAKGLRFYHSQNFVNFFRKFSQEFEWYETQVEQIAYEMLNKKEDLNEYYRYNFLEIYAEVIGEKKYRAYWKELEKKYPNFNYFEDILENNSEKSGEELQDMRFFFMAQTILVEKYAKKDDILWRVKQITNAEPIQATSRFDDEYPSYRGVRSWSGRGKYEEIEWMSMDREEFAYIFSLERVGKIDVSYEMLKILEKSLKIMSLEEKNKNLFADYLQKIFFKYFEKFDEKLSIKEFYFEILKTLEKYDYKYYYNFNFEFFRKKFGVKNVEENKKISVKDKKKSDSKTNNSQINEFIETEPEKYKKCIPFIKEYKNKISKLEEENKKNIDNFDKELRSRDEKINSLNRKIHEKDEELRRIKSEIGNIESLYQIQKTDLPDCIVYVEWLSDKIVLDYILDKNIFYREKKYKIQVINSNNCRWISNNITYIKEIKERENFDTPVLGIYDFDFEWFNEFKNVIKKWNSKSWKENIVEEDYFFMKTKKEPDTNIFSSLLPVPNSKISEQVIYKDIPSNRKNKKEKDWKSDDNYKDFWTSSLLVLEHLFYDLKIWWENYQKIEEELFDKEPAVWSWSWKLITIKKRKKVDFIKKMIYKDFFDNPELIEDEELFVHFKPIIKMIDRIASWEFDDQKREEN